MSQEEAKKQDGESYLHMCCSKDIVTSSQSCPTKNVAFNRKVMCNCEHSMREGEPHGISKTLRWINHKQDCDKDQFVPSCLQTNNTQSSKIDKKASPRTQDKETQTAGFSNLTSQDASVQCCLLKPNRMSIVTEPTTFVHRSRKHKASASRSQSHHSSENHDNQFAPEKVASNTSCMTSEKEPTKQGPEIIIGNESSSKSESRTCIKIHPLLHGCHTIAPGIKN